MKNNKILAFGLSVLMLSPLAVSAAGLIPCDGVTVKCDFNAAAALVNNIINQILLWSGIIATVTFSIAGAKILLNPSDPTKITEGRGMLTKTIYGMLIILGAWLVIHSVIAAIINPNINALRFFGN